MATSLTIFKIKNGITNHNDIVVNRDRLRAFPVSINRSLLGILYVRRNPLKLPSWLEFFEGIVDFEGMELRTTAAKAVLVIQRDANNVFALTFGYGRWMIEDTAIAALQPQLDATLVARMRRRAPLGVWLAPPEILSWDEVRGFRYRGSANAPIHDDLDLDEYIDDTGPRREITIERLRKDRVRAVSAIDGADRQDWAVYRCLVAELAVRDETYVLNEGKWYRVDRDFLADVNAAVAALPATNAALPPFRQRSERNYNRRAHEQSGGRFALLDRQMIASVGRGSVESCDLFTLERQLIHVKRYTGSGTLSHLFNQGVVSGELFAYDRTFRQGFNDLLPATHRLAQPAAAIVPGEYEVAYAIIARRGAHFVLPFFSKVTLRNAARVLRQIGYTVTLTAIPTP